MSEQIGRLGYLGLAVESDSGSAESSPDIYIPYIENSLRGHHEPLMDISARASRVKDYSSVEGKKWGEGSVAMYLDGSNSGYLLKMALGTEARTEKNTTPPVHDHLMYPTVSGNAMTTATLWDYKGVDVEQYTYGVVDTCEIEVTTDGIATLRAGILSQFPSTVTAPDLTTVSGTIFTWKDMNAYFGDTVADAEDSTAIKLNNFKVAVANNASLNYKTGSEQPDSISSGPIEVTGSYALYFENATDRDRYYDLKKQTCIVNLTGAGLGSGYTERLQIVLKKIVIEDVDIETGLEDLFALTCNYRAEWDQDQAGYVEATVRNGKADNYA